MLSFGLADERERRSFERECRAMGLVSQHPHIVTVFNSAFTSTKQPCIVMELYSGGTMIDRQRREGSLSVATVLDVGVKISGALQTAHDRGLLHRDIKPQNLFISEFGEPALGDFGISTLDDERSISGSGGLTVHYAPPEVLEGAPASPISDLYSFAATLFTLLEGARPFAAGADRRQSVGELARRIMLEEPPRPGRSDVPRSLADLLARTMAKEPGRRPPSAAAFGQELQRIQSELGVPVTTLPVVGTPDGLPTVPRGPAPPWPATATGEATDPGGAGPDVAVAPAPAAPAAADAPAPASPEVQLRSPDHADDDEGHTVTIGQARAAPETPSTDRPDPDTGGAHVSTRRAVVGTAAAVVCLLLVAGVLLLFGRSGDDPDDPTTTGSGIVDVTGPALGVAAPAGVAAVTTADGQSATVSWTQPADSTSIEKYQVRRVDSNEVVDTPDGQTYAVSIPITPGTSRACFVVIAVAVGGSFSEESAYACL